MIRRARFTIRPNETGEGDLILGAMFKGAGALLMPGRIYQIEEVMGTLQIRDLGPNAVGRTLDDSFTSCCWGHSVSHLLAEGGGEHLLTFEEWREDWERRGGKFCLNESPIKGRFCHRQRLHQGNHSTIEGDEIHFWERGDE
jgi:hypothetical protein